MMKIMKDEKRKRKRIRQSMKKKGDKRKVKGNKGGKEKEREQWNELPFFMLFLLSLSFPKGVMSRDIPLGGGR